MDLETENRIAAILMKEAAELRRQAEKDGVHAYLHQPNVRGRPNSRFLTATVLSVQQANRAVEVNEMWRIRQKEQELDDRLKRRRRDERSSDRSYREQELDDSLKIRRRHERSSDRSYRDQVLDDSLKRRQRDESSSDRSYREPELDDKLKRRQRDESSSDRSYIDTEDLWRSTNKSHADGEGKTSEYCSSKRIMQEYHLNEEEGLRDDEVENFLNSRVKRGRGAVGSRMDETGPYLPPCQDSKGNQLAIPDVAAREEWEHNANLRLEKPSRLKSLNSSEDESFEDKKHKKTKKAGSSKHNRKHKSKEKSKDKKRKRKEERRHKLRK